MPLRIDGKLYKLGNGKEVMLYPIAKLSQAFADADNTRYPQTLRGWIKKGIIPQPLFRIGKIKPKALYTQEQIDLIVKTVEDCGVRKGVAISSTNFQEELRIKWIELCREYI